MPIAKHQHAEKCPCSTDSYYLDYLVDISPDFLWYDVQDVGSYQGSIYGIAEYKGKVAIYKDGYGSCSGCGAWEEPSEWNKEGGAQPKTQDEIISACEFYDDEASALEAISKIDRYDDPNRATMKVAVKEIFNPEQI